MDRKQKIMLFRIISSALILICLLIADPEGVLRLVLFTALYLFIGYDILIEAFYGVIHGQVLDENFLMAVATIGAYALALYDRSGDYTEAIAVMLFYQIGEFFQGYAVRKSRKSIAALMDIKAEYANFVKDDEILKCEPEEIPVGSVIEVRNGEKVPLDGIVISGNATVDTSQLTGESLPVEKNVGDEVLSGCISKGGVIRIRVTKEYSDSTVARILFLVENASSRKSRSENFISKFARIYTPIVCALSLALFIIPPLVNILILSASPAWHTWLYRALTFLVISCPCALVISVPLSFFSTLGSASREGILIKGSNYVETLSGIKKIIFDKTGTLTEGRFTVKEVHYPKMDENELVRLVAYAESISNHPISQSIVSHYGRKIDAGAISEAKEIAGRGVAARVDGHSVLCGNESLMKDYGIPYIPCHSTGSIVHVAIDGEYMGHIVISDVLKKESADTIAMLRKEGIEEIIMLTGDSEKSAESVSSELNLDGYYAQLLPSDKVEKAEQIISSSSAKTAFVGDGINDAPVLARSDVGIAMGALGSDAAIEAADVVLMDDDISKIPLSMRIAKKCMRIVWENIVFALSVKFLCLILGALGIADMWLAIFADVGVMIIAVINSMRALSVRK